MRIIILSKYQGKVERGVENYVAELAPRLKNSGHKVEILTSVWQLIGKKAEIIYPLNGYWQSFGCRVYAWLTGTKLVLGGHAGIGRDDRWNLYMFPDLFIVFSQKGFDWAKKVNPFVKIVKIPHGVNLEKFNFNVKPADLDLEKPRFVTAANLVEYKRVKETIKAVAKLKKGSLLVLGDGPLETEIDDLGDQLLNGLSSRSASRRSGDLTDSEIAASPSTIAQGPRNDGQRKRYLRLKVAHNEITKYLNACDVFTLVSEESEAFGLVYLEAMACNLPVVGTDDSLRRELIGAAGVFVKNPEDSREYAERLEKAIGEDWGNAPRKQVEKFGWKKIADIYETVFTTRLVT